MDDGLLGGRLVEIAVVLALGVATGVPSAQGQDRAVIPYQGQLAEQSGAPVNPAEGITLVFRTYSGATGGAANWEEAHEDVQVVGGRFSVLLGGRQPFPPEVDFRRTVYLGVTVDDGRRETADVEMRPRQAIVPAVAAQRAVLADRATVADRAAAADRAAVAERLAEESALAREVLSLRADLSDLITYVGSLRERIRDLEDAAAGR